MFMKLPALMMKKNDYTQIPEDYPGGNGAFNGSVVIGGGSSVSSSAVKAHERRNRNRFWDGGSFFRSWSLMKVLALGMVCLLLGIIVFQGIEENDIVEKKTVAHNLEVLNNEQLKIEKSLKDDQDDDDDDDDSIQPYTPFIFRDADQIPIPPGVNIGSWLSLEDYFFAGQHNSIEVATPGQFKTNDASQVASCLPPLHVGKITGPKWFSETDLFMNLMNNSTTIGGSVQHAISVFQAHRSSYVDLEIDLNRIASLGIKTIRIPMSWCLTDYDPRRIDLSNYTDNELLNRFACIDPFYNNTSSEGNDRNTTNTNKSNTKSNTTTIYWPAIPKPFIEDILKACSRVGLRASLDVHTYPGGTSIGTFSGVWPNWPKFWTNGGDGVNIGKEYIPITTTNTGDNDNDKETNNNQTTTSNTTDDKYGNGKNGKNIGHILFHELVSWMEELSIRDPFAFNGLRGLSPMNEPAHLAGNFYIDDEDNFLPPLPDDLAMKYRKQLSRTSSSSSTEESDLESDFPDGTHLRVLYWFHGAIDIFRNSKLPSLGKELHANIHESVFKELSSNSSKVDAQMRYTAVANWWCSDVIDENVDDDDENENDDSDDDDDDDNDSMSTITPTTTVEERSTWAILDVHHYHAWSDTCSGTIDGQDNAAYACGDIDRRHKVLKGCARWAQTFRDIIDNQCTIKKKKKKKKDHMKKDEQHTYPVFHPHKEQVKLMSAEFSSASHHNSRKSCNDIGGLRESYVRQVNAGEKADVELFYWSYQMPYGGTFRQAWSFTQLMFNLGVVDRPDTPQFDCDSNSIYDNEIPP